MDAIRDITNPRMRTAAIGWYALGCGYDGVATAAFSILTEGKRFTRKAARRWRKPELSNYFLAVIREEQRKEWIEEWDALEEWEWACHG